MTDKADESGRAPNRPGDASRRPHATIDLKATEVGGSRSKSGFRFADRVRVMRRWGGAALGRNSFLSHVAAGVAGAVLTLMAAALFGLFGGTPTSSSGVPVDVGRRLAALVQKTAQLPASATDIPNKIASAEARVKALEERTASVPALADAQAKLAAQTKALEGRPGGAPELAARLAKLETALAAVASNGKGAGGSGGEVLAPKLAEVEKLAADASEAARATAQRVDRDLAGLKTDAARLAQRLDGLKGEVEAQLKDAARSADLAPVLGKLSAFEKDLQGFLRGESERSANARRVLLTLEMANLKRAMDRGDRYTTQLDAVKQAAGGALKLAALERHKLDGVQTLQDLAKGFRPVANAAADAEAEPADASVLDRLVAGAKGIVRVRKAGHDAQDTSVEAVTGRMESALKDGRLGEVLAQGKTLPPKAALAFEDWMRKVEARYAVDQAMAQIENDLKTSLSLPAAEPKR
jgi:hypothetical protein